MERVLNIHDELRARTWARIGALRQQRLSSVPAFQAPIEEQLRVQERVLAAVRSEYGSAERTRGYWATAAAIDALDAAHNAVARAREEEQSDLSWRPGRGSASAMNLRLDDAYRALEAARAVALPLLGVRRR